MFIIHAVMNPNNDQFTGSLERGWGRKLSTEQNLTGCGEDSPVKFQHGTTL
jgi:hypothetical protein